MSHPHSHPITDDPLLDGATNAYVDSYIGDLGTSDTAPVAFHVLAQDATSMAWALARRCKRLQDERDATFTTRLSAYKGWFVDEVLRHIKKGA